MTTHEQLLKKFDDLDSDIDQLLTRYRKVKQNRKALLEACKAIVNFISDPQLLHWNEGLKCWTINDGLVDPLILPLEAAIAQAESEE